MDINISKKFNLTIDTIDTKPIRLKDNFVIGDSIELSINLVENKSPKDITGAKIRLLVSNDGVFEQVNHIEITDETKGLIKIQLEPHMINKLNMNLYQIMIEDINENINCQKFIVNVIDSLATQVILEAQDGLSTLLRLNQEIDNYTVALNDIKQHVEDVSKDVDVELISINNKLKTIDDSIIALDNKLNNTSDAIGKLPQRIELTPMRPSGSSIYYLQTNTIKNTGLELLDTSFMVTIKGKALNDSTVQSATGILSFQMMNDSKGVPTVYAYIDTLSDRAVQGKVLGMSVVFDNMVNNIPASATNFKIYVKNNINANLQYQSEVSGSMSAIGNNLKF